jgi:thioredoxin 1
MSAVAVLETTQEFDSFVAGKSVAVVEFWADWCGPCKQVAPVLEAIAADNPTLPFGKIDADKVGDLIQRYGIYSLPATLVMKDGRPADHISGAFPRATFEAKIKSSI